MKTHVSVGSYLFFTCIALLVIVAIAIIGEVCYKRRQKRIKILKDKIELLKEPRQNAREICDDILMESSLFVEMHLTQRQIFEKALASLKRYLDQIKDNNDDDHWHHRFKVLSDIQDLSRRAGYEPPTLDQMFPSHELSAVEAGR